MKLRTVFLFFIGGSKNSHGEAIYNGWFYDSGINQEGLARLETERFTNRRVKRTQYCAFQRVDDVLLYDAEGAEEFSRFFSIPGLNHCGGIVDLRLS